MWNFRDKRSFSTCREESCGIRENGSVSGTATSPQKFNFSKPEEWPKWSKRFERFRVVSGLELLPEENQVNTLIYTMGDEAEDILTSLRLTLEHLSEYNTVIERPNEHFVVRRNLIFEHAQFNMWQQEAGQSADNFIPALHWLAEHCGYGQFYSEIIWDRLVVGLRLDNRLPEQLQMDPMLTLEKAVIRTRQSELVKKQQEELKANFKSDCNKNVDIIHAQQRPYNKRMRHDAE